MEVPPVKALSLGSYRTVTVITACTVVGLGVCNKMSRVHGSSICNTEGKASFLSDT